MGLGDIVSNVLIKVKGDTSDAKRAVRDLRGVEKQAARERLAEIERENRSIDDTISKWGKITIGVGVAAAAIKTAQVAAKAYLEDIRLESAAAGVNIDRLRAATGGLVETDRLLAFAGKTQAGVWKLNEQEMERVLHGAMALRKTMGTELEPTIDALTEAITKGATRGLKEFGIEAKDKGQALAKLDELWKSLGGNASMAGDEMAQAGVAWKDAVDDLMGSLGELVVALGPAIKALADLANGFVDAASALGRDPMSAMRQARADQKNSAWESMDKARMLLVNAQLRQLGIAPLEDVQAAEQQAAFQRQIRDAMAKDWWGLQDTLYQKKINDQLAARGPRKLPNAGDPLGFLRDFGGALPGVGQGLYGAAQSTIFAAQTSPLAYRGTALGIDQAQTGAAANGIQGDIASAKESIAQMQQMFAALDQLKSTAGQETIFSQILGTPAEINATVEAITLAHSAFQGFTNAAVSGYTAMVTGSESFAKAFQHAIAQAVLALGQQMFVESLKHAAFAIGDLAIGNFAGAGTHAAAAAAFLAGSAAAGVAARAMGVGQSSGGAGGSAGRGSGAGSYLPRGGGSSGGGEQTTVIYLGDMSGLTELERADLVIKGVKQAQRRRGGGGSSTIRHS